MKSRWGERLYSAVFEDDGRVAYIYLLYDGNIINDVWIYNVGSTPKISPWTKAGAKPPFKNSKRFVVDGAFDRVQLAEEIEFRWRAARGDRFDCLEIWVRGVFHADITEKTKPGRCRLASIDGPLARAM